jgi:hypothetical protein
MLMAVCDLGASSTAHRVCATCGPRIMAASLLMLTVIVSVLPVQSLPPRVPIGKSAE